MSIDTSATKYAIVVKEVYFKSGLDSVFNWLIELELKRKPEPVTIARWYAMLGNKDKALNWLEKAFEERASEIPRIYSDPDFDNLRWEPRFQAIIEKMGLSEYAK